MSRLGPIGPRARRRLIAVGAAVVVIAAIAIGFTLLTRSSDHGSPSGPKREVGPNGDKRYVANSEQLVFGMTRSQVRKIVGPPTAVVGNCWDFRLDEVIHVFGQSHPIDAERVCFYGGKYSTHYTKWEGRWQDDDGNAVPNPSQ